MSDAPAPAEVPVLVTHIQVDTLPGADGDIEVRSGEPTFAQAEAIGIIGVASTVEQAQAPAERSLLRKILHLGPKEPARKILGEDGSGPRKF